ncbi:MAG: hypothetical protein ACM35H_12700 [Bacteroidota bacterium]
MAACAAIALAAVFSVQQGEHGPLVVYKLQQPGQRSSAPPVPIVIPNPVPLAEPAAEPPPVFVVIPSRAPAILGTVVLPAPAPLPATLPAEPELPAPAEGTITLQQVSDEILWRRETLERLPEAPFAPRF